MDVEHETRLEGGGDELDNQADGSYPTTRRETSINRGEVRSDGKSGIPTRRSREQTEHKGLKTRGGQISYLKTDSGGDALRADEN